MRRHRSFVPSSRIRRQGRVRRGLMVASVMAVAALVAACGGGSKSAGAPSSTAPSASKSTTSTGGGPSGSSGSSKAGVEEDPEHRVVVVNLLRADDGTEPGPTVDVVQVPQETAGVPARVTGLGFGQSSEAVHPGRKASEFHTGAYGITLVRSGSSGTAADEVVMPAPTSDWKFRIVAVTGTVKSPMIEEFDADPAGSQSNQIPAPADGKVVVLASNSAMGSPGTSPKSNASILFGPLGSCLPSTDPAFSGDPASQVTGASRFAVPAGTATVGFWTSDKNQWTPADCAGAPLVTADMSALNAGDRAVVLLHGPDDSKPSATVVRVPS